MLGQPPRTPKGRGDKQRSRARIAWMIGAPIAGLLIGLWIPAIALQVAEQSYKTSVSSQASVSVMNHPQVTTTVTEQKTVTVHPATPEATTTAAATVTPPPASTPSGAKPAKNGPQPTTNGTKPDYGAPVRDYCKGKFPSAADQKAYALCVNQTSGGTVKP